MTPPMQGKRPASSWGLPTTHSIAWGIARGLAAQRRRASPSPIRATPAGDGAEAAGGKGRRVAGPCLA